MRDQVLQIILEAAASINDTLEHKLALSEGEACALYGEGSPLDSISLVALIAAVEQGLEDELNAPIILASEKAMSRRNSPFLRVGTLTDYAVELVREAK